MWISMEAMTGMSDIVLMWFYFHIHRNSWTEKCHLICASLFSWRIASRFHSLQSLHDNSCTYWQGFGAFKWWVKFKPTDKGYYWLLYSVLCHLHCVYLSGKSYHCINIYFRVLNTRFMIIKIYIPRKVKAQWTLTCKVKLVCVQSYAKNKGLITQTTCKCLMSNVETEFLIILP